MNTGLLTALGVAQAAADAYAAGHVPLNAAEGFIRQIIGWREYIRGYYWLEMPKVAAANGSMRRGRCPNSTGPARPTCCASLKRSATPATTPMRTTSSG